MVGTWGAGGLGWGGAAASAERHTRKFLRRGTSASTVRKCGGGALKSESSAQVLSIHQRPFLNSAGEAALMMPSILKARQKCLQFGRQCDAPSVLKAWHTSAYNPGSKAAVVLRRLKAAFHSQGTTQVPSELCTQGGTGALASQGTAGVPRN